MSLPARALVVTVVHHPEDARIRHRQIDALLSAGWEVTYAAPFSGYGLPASSAHARLAVIDLPRALGRSRVAPLRSARSLLESHGAGHDVVLLHDPELLLATRRLDLPPVVWDVHEDTAAAVSLKPWLPAGVRRPAAWAVRRLERRAEQRVNLLLAEHAYQDRFRKQHPVVPNTTKVPISPQPPDEPRLVYVGHLTRPRGVFELIELGHVLNSRTEGRLQVQLVGHADDEAAAALSEAADVVDWLGFLPHDEAMGVLDGALAGLSLMHDEPNYRVSQPTKVVEYLAHGVPVITTPLPHAQRLVEDVGAGLVVPFGDVTATADAVLALEADPSARQQMGKLGHAHAREQFDWSLRSREFVSRMGAIAGAPRV
jgi:glycosyltransferase involved in cell wall biosynthesis